MLLYIGARIGGALAVAVLAVGCGRSGPDSILLQRDEAPADSGAAATAAPASALETPPAGPPASVPGPGPGRSIDAAPPNTPARPDAAVRPDTASAPKATNTAPDAMSPPATPDAAPDVTPAPPPGPPAPTGLVTIWKLDGTAVDGTGNKRDGTLYGGPSFGAGKVGQALLLDGVDDYADMGVHTAFQFTGDFTVTAWVKTTQGVVKDDYPVIVGNTSAVTPRTDWGLYLNNAQSGATWLGVLWIQGKSYAAKGAIGLNDGQWHHVAFQRKGTTLTSFTDGTPGSDTTGVPATALVSGSPLRLGSSNFSCCPYLYQGALDDVRIYSRALTGNEIRTVMSGK